MSKTDALNGRMRFRFSVVDPQRHSRAETVTEHRAVIPSLESMRLAPVAWSVERGDRDR